MSFLLMMISLSPAKDLSCKSFATRIEAERKLSSFWFYPIVYIGAHSHHVNTATVCHKIRTQVESDLLVQTARVVLSEDVRRWGYKDQKYWADSDGRFNAFLAASVKYYHYNTSLFFPEDYYYHHQLKIEDRRYFAIGDILEKRKRR